MEDIERISVQEARQRVQGHGALLVCAYENEAKCQRMQLEGAIPVSGLAARSSTLPKEQEIIFY